MFSSTKRVLCCCFAMMLLTISYNSAFAQVGNTPPPSSGSGVGQNNGSPFTNSNNGGGISGSTNADADGGDPGGPTDPPDDIVPIDGGVGILLAIGLVHGYLASQRRRKLKPAIQVTK